VKPIRRFRWLLLLVLVLGTLLAACGKEEVEVTRVVTVKETVVEKETVVQTVVEKETVVLVSTQPPAEPAPTTPSPTATGEAPVPAGWMTHTSQRCEYALSYPADMEISNEGANSRTIGFKVANPDQVAWNFVYVSVIAPDFQSLGGELIYNYDPAATDLLLNLQVGESKPVHDNPQLAPWYTYQRQPDTTISGYAAQTYENVQPWEFPAGTKEMRYYLSLNGCTFLIGAYLDTTGSNQPGAISEDLFQQIVATAGLMP
jgi:hypothetical protein